MVRPSMTVHDWLGLSSGFRNLLFAALSMYPSLGLHAAETDEVEVPNVMLSAERIQAEKDYAAAKDAAATKFYSCVIDVRTSGFLGLGTKELHTSCVTERVALTSYLPQDRAAEVLDQIETTIMNAEPAR